MIRVCREATARNGNGTVVEVVCDPLDGTAWVRMSSWPRAGEALAALNSHGISGHDCEDGRLHITGWDVRLLHWRLGALLADVDDLTSEWDATAAIVCYHHDRRVTAGVDPDPAEVLADVETAMRRWVPIPHQAPRVQDIDSVLELIAAAEDAISSSSPSTSTTPKESSLTTSPVATEKVPHERLDLARTRRVIPRRRPVLPRRVGRHTATGRPGPPEQWGRRFTSALEAIKSEDARARFLGRTLLADLGSSELASSEERQLADHLLNEEARFDPHGSDLRLVLPGPELDDTDFIEDD